MRKPAPAAAALIPIWFQFSSRFYRRLAAIANECNLDPADVVKRGMRLVLQQQRDRSTQVPQKTPAGLSIYRWRNIPAEERSRMSREMARKTLGQSEQDQARLEPLLQHVLYDS